MGIKIYSNLSKKGIIKEDGGVDGEGKLVNKNLIPAWSRCMCHNIIINMCSD